jgi:hypothetical protein
MHKDLGWISSNIYTHTHTHTHTHYINHPQIVNGTTNKSSNKIITIIMVYKATNAIDI